jgi:hypothetical protein
MITKTLAKFWNLLYNIRILKQDSNEIRTD